MREWQSFRNKEIYTHFSRTNILHAYDDGRSCTEADSSISQNCIFFRHKDAVRSELFRARLSCELCQEEGMLKIKQIAGLCDIFPSRSVISRARVSEIKRAGN